MPQQRLLSTANHQDATRPMKRTFNSAEGPVRTNNLAHISFRYFKTSPEIIQLAVMLYERFPLSLINVGDLLHERGVDVSY